MLQINGHEYYCLGCRRREWLMKKTLEIESGSSAPGASLMPGVCPGRPG